MNKYQEALEKLVAGAQGNIADTTDKDEDYEEILKYEKNLQELVDKETPMKVFLNKEYKIVQCPTCKVVFLDYIRSSFGSVLRHTKRCDDCGQVLDWEVNEDDSE